ncbi:MAG: acyltransferase [Planctomycetaceae bacterium]|nr:acyltransferase [Planctomycetaceae bacterium]
MADFTLGYRKSLDGLRGIAVVLVVLSHIPSLPFGGGFFGVDLFFVLSGFLITSLLFEEWRANGDISLKAFYARRALRLLPALVEVLGVAAIVSGRWESAEAAARMRESALMTLCYCANWFVAYRSYPRGELSHTWSLSVEEQFYVVWPLLLLVLLRSGWSRRRMAAVLVAGMLGSALLRAVLWLTTKSWERVYFGSDTHADGLFAGALVALLVHAGAQPSTEAWRRILNWVAHLMMGYLGFFFVSGWAADPYLMLGGYLGLNLGAAAVVLCLVTSPWAPLRLLCEAPPLVWLGKISYGVYLWHSVVFWTLGVTGLRIGGPAWALPLGALLAVSAASYYGFERPLLKLKQRFERVRASAP